LQFIRTGANPLGTIAAVQAALQAFAATPLWLMVVGALPSAIAQSAARVSVMAVAMTQAGLSGMDQVVLIPCAAGLGSSRSLAAISPC
jgi:Na+/phosphate symporter